jgi:hypothetical protein
MDLFLSDDIPFQEGERTLNCSCPKCSAKIELELAAVNDGTTSQKCPECKASFVLTRESFASRAARHVGEINCALCGAGLDHFQYCPSCKALYPDYYAAEFPDAVKKRARQKRDMFGGLKNISFQLASSKAPSLDYQPVLLDSEAWQEPVPSTGKRITGKVVAAVVVLAVIAIGAVYYNNHQSKKDFVKSYILALYGTKSGTDLSIKVCKQIAADWAVKGLTTPPRALVDDENQLNKIKSQTDKYLQKLNDPPSAYLDSNEKLKQLNSLYNKLNTAALNPTGTITSLTELTQKTETEFQAAADILKKGLPAELSDELKVAKLKYRGMKDF